MARVAEIVNAMKIYAHPGVTEKTSFDLGRAVETTMTVARNEWKTIAEVEVEVEPELPMVPCLPGEMSQVFLNIVVNASHAIADAIGDGSEGKGRITIRTRRLAEHAEVRIGDTGTGIPEHVRERLFDPFFTTKQVGKGTGQGLHIAHSVIARKHGGTLTFETELGVGTVFVIRLPLVQADQPEDTPEATRPAGELDLAG